jgi:hypothetical protein
MKRIPLLIACIALTGIPVMADSTTTAETVTVDGQVVSKFATKLTFNGDEVTLNYEDNSSQTALKSLVSIDFTYDSSTGISDINADHPDKVDQRVYHINGQYVGDTTDRLPHGVYITNGKKIVVK